MNPIIGPWRRLPFTVRFAAILVLTAVVIAATAAAIAANDARVAAINQASYGLAVAESLVADQDVTAQKYAREVVTSLAHQAALGAQVDSSQILSVDSQGSPTDVVVLTSAAGLTAYSNGSPVSANDPLVKDVAAALASRVHFMVGPKGEAWLIQSAPVPEMDATLVVAHELMSGVPATMVVHKGVITNAGSLDGVDFAAGSRPPAAVIPDSASLAMAGTHQIAFASHTLGNGYMLVALSSVTNTMGTLGALIFIGVLLLAITWIVLLIRLDLQVPLRRVDRAVAALAAGDFDQPLPQFEAHHEFARLAQTFDDMRMQLRFMLDESRARATIATELNAQQPLHRALSKVCNEVRAITGARSVLLCIAESEISDSFVSGPEEEVGIDPDDILGEDQPIGAWLATKPTSPALLWVENPLLGGGATVQAAPIGLGDRRFGMVAAVFGDDATDTARYHNMLAATAEQVALALERYRFIVMVQEQATIDDLTGLHNHRFLVDHISQQVALAERLETPLSLLMLDIDHFKHLNDTYGHAAGDAALQTFAMTLKANVRRSDLAARYGGEEFVVVMPGASEEDASHVAEKIRAAVARQKVNLGGKGETTTITVSVGVASFPQNTNAATELLRLADEALYRAKEGGRNRVVNCPAHFATVMGTGGFLRKKKAATPWREDDPLSW